MRKGKGRRQIVRVPTSLPIEWGTSKECRQHGKITSLSADGCLLATAAVQPLYGKVIYIRVPLPDQDWWEIQGEVLYYVRDVGFGVQFLDMTDNDKGTLRQLMQHYRESASSDPKLFTSD